jgi:hypothetical protein
MNMRHSALIVGFLCMSFAVTVSVEAESSTRSHEGPVDYAGLVKALSETGATVKPGGRLSEPFFAPSIPPTYTPVDHALLLTVDGQRVQVFEFLTPEDAETAAATIAPDGSSIGPIHVSWIDLPHFWKTGRLIVLYVGNDGDILHLLTTLLGPQCAGSDSPPSFSPTHPSVR